MDLSTRRKNYDKGELDETSLNPDPIAQFKAWLDEALSSGMIEPTAMTLATATPDGHVSARVVLLKSVDEAGFIFYSNYGSHKGRDLEANPRAALVLYWDVLERQVRVEGTVSRLSREASNQYFQTRPYKSQIGALASRQSTRLPDRKALEARMTALSETHPEGGVPLPEDWGGYQVQPDYLEFWQGRRSRLHDRLCYRRDGNSWQIFRLSP